MIQKIYLEDLEVALKLDSFGVTKKELNQIIHQAVTARRDTVEFDPVTASGYNSWAMGTRWLRNIFCGIGWDSYRKKNIEGVICPKTGAVILFQNVDLACNKFKNPKATSSKGDASKALVKEHKNQYEMYNASDLRAIKDNKANVWYLCVSASDEHICAELSMPSEIINGQFLNFTHRIFLYKEGDWEVPNIVDFTDDDSIQEIEININRK